PLCSAFDIFHELELAATSMEEILYEKEALKIAAHDFLANQRNTFYIGRGNDYYVALEAALKLKEISYIQAEGFAAGELKHGTIALIEEATPVIGLITDEKTKAHTRGNLQEVKSRGAHVLVIVQANFAQDGDQVRLPVVHPYLTTLTSVVPTQLLAYYATLERGYDVDKPRNLAKSVTVE
ncbi:MAG: SIS domain-containing protein, partial [Enterococcus sp.]|nr:SIS domain-containing protein [Enterococcus sp.]